MAYARNLIPHPEDYYRGLCGRLHGQGKWRTACCNFCEFHTLQVNVKTGAYVCTDCGASGNDVLDHHMELVGADEVQAAKGLGAWWYGRAAPATRLEVCHGF